MLAAGAMLTQGKAIAPREIWGGRPAKFMRTQDEAQVEKIRFQTERYCALAERHLAMLRGESRSLSSRRPRRSARWPMRRAAGAAGHARRRIEAIEIGEDRLLVKVRAKPHDGAANDAVLALLAEALGVATSRLRMLRGATSREKLVQLL